VVAIFNIPLALDLAGPLLALSAAGVVLAVLCLRLGARGEEREVTAAPEAKAAGQNKRTNEPTKLQRVGRSQWLAE
jgi:hypothetical protein